MLSNKGLATISIVLLLISSVVPLVQFVSSSEPNSIWVPLSQENDNNEGGEKNDWRDVKQSYYSFNSIDEKLSLRLECYGIPGSEWPKSGGRYKWFIDISNPSDMELSGGNIVGADYLIYVEDTNDDGTGDIYLLEEDGDGSFNDEEPLVGEYYFEPITDNSIIMTISLDLIDSTTNMALTWATDQEDPNMDAAPNNDRVDGKVGIAGKISQVTFDQGGAENFDGELLTVNGSSFDALDLPISFWAMEGTKFVFAYSSPLELTDVEQYIWDNTTGLSNLQAGELAVSGSGTVTGYYTTQYYLDLNVVPQNLQTPTGEGWYDTGALAPISAEEFLGAYKFENWISNNGLLIGNVSAPSTTVLMDNPGTVTANYVPTTSITVNNVVVDEPPSGVWKYTVTGPDSYLQNFDLTHNVGESTWFSGYGIISGDYNITETTKFGYHTYIEIEGDVDGESVISGSNIVVDLDEGESITVTYINTYLPAFTISLDDAPPANLDYNIPELTPTFAQSAWSTDINDDGRIDLVLDKPAAVMINFTGASVSSDLSVSLQFLGETYQVVKTNAQLASNSIISFYPIIPNVVGPATLTGSYSIDGATSISFSPVDVTIKETTSPSIAYSYLYNFERKGYEDLSIENFQQTAGNSTELIETAYPISSLLTDQSYVGLEGAEKGGKKDPFKGILTDALAVAQEAQLRMGGTAIGIGIGPNNPGINDYFTYHGFSGAAGISFGPSVKGVIILDGYYGGSAHEIAHTYGLYYGMPEEYQLYPVYGKLTSGVRVETGEWMTGYDIMGAVAYGTLEDTWIDSDTFAQLFTQLAINPEDPMVLLASGIINENGTVEYPNTWYSLGAGYPDENIVEGDYALILVDENGEIIAETKFDAQFQVQIGGYPAVEVGTDGDQINTTAFETYDTNSTGFSFVIPYNPRAAEVQIWNLTSNEQIGVMDASDIVNLAHCDVESWTTCSSYVNITSLDANFKKDSKTKTSSLITTNPGTMYLNVAIENNEDYTINPLIKVTLPDAVDSLGEIVSPAFLLKGANPVHVYSDLERTNDVTINARIEIEGKTITIGLTIPEGDLAVVTIHLDYALKDTEGWPFDASQTYLQNLPFEVYAPRILEDGTVIFDLTVPFEVVGSENN